VGIPYPFGAWQGKSASYVRNVASLAVSWDSTNSSLSRETIKKLKNTGAFSLWLKSPALGVLKLHRSGAPISAGRIYPDIF